MACSTTARVILPGRGTHFVNACIASTPAASRWATLAAKLANEILGRPVVVGKVEGREASIEELEHRGDGRAGSMGP